MARTKSPSIPNAPTSRKSKRTKQTTDEIADVTPKNALVVSDENAYAKSAAALKILRSKSKEAADALLIERVKACGGHVYTQEELCKKFNLKPDPNWTQERMQWIGEVGEFLQPILQLRKKAEATNTKYIVPGRKAIRKLVESAYELYVKASESSRRHDVFEQLRGRLASDGVTVHKDAPDASVIIRTVFEDFDSKQVHLYGKSLEYAMEQKIATDKFSDFVAEEGGFEKIRSTALRAGKKEDLRLTQARMQSDEERAREILEFRRTEPLIELELTQHQYAHLKPNVTVSTPDKNMDMVVLLAEMDPIDFKMCNVYGTVPMTPELRRAIEKTLGEFQIFDADFAERFYAWKDKRTEPATKKNADERMNDRVAAMLARSAKREAAKQAANDIDNK
jgi:hypothetical protein